MSILFKQARKGGASCTDYEVLNIMLGARGIKFDASEWGSDGRSRRIWVAGSYLDFNTNGNLEDIDSRHP